jgi:hypothetical protein
MRFHHIIAAAWLAITCIVMPAYAEKRVALVVGNAAYRHADRLAYPVSDAQGMRDALKRLGFDVIYGEDLDQNALRRLIGQFGGRVDNADVALVYFAGHGATFGDTPYVVPVDAEFASADEVPYQLVAVETLIGELRRAKGVRIAILDACRDNAAELDLKRRATRGGPAPRGLAPMKNPSGLIIAYATQYLSTAADDARGRRPRQPVLLRRRVRPAQPVHGGAAEQHRHAGPRRDRHVPQGRARGGRGHRGEAAAGDFHLDVRAVCAGCGCAAGWRRGAAAGQGRAGVRGGAGVGGGSERAEPRGDR